MYITINILTSLRIIEIQDFMNILTSFRIIEIQDFLLFF
jgi:hypothetical protein